MTKSELPENFTEHGKELNRVSWSDREKLDARGQNHFDMIDKQKDMEQRQAKADNERYREQRIEKEIDRLLRTPAPHLEGPAPVVGGSRVDRPEGVAREHLSPEQMRRIRETAEQNVRKAEEMHLRKIDQVYTRAQRDLLDKALGPDRYPKGR